MNRCGEYFTDRVDEDTTEKDLFKFEPGHETDILEVLAGVRRDISGDMDLENIGE